ncbi:MAG: glycerol-3-phosphate ABC transporter ATP-binding protein [Elusimicrobia bacterium RIFOXYB2_FULL_49_7]|nr:MAG: glycerol-3-phosphate ABC transporter ATP-binding protein [Elusimicrobia bacterium RIFOXYB2_FULL_49_7]
MATVTFEHVFKEFSNGKVVAVKDFNLEIKDREFIVLVGPSGCGKTTSLRMVAGLEDVTRGDILIDGNRVNDVPPKDRDIAMVFQNYALYPHMDVYNNMAFGLNLRKYPRDEIDRRVKEAADILNIRQYLARRPRELSGGQMQRVAVGRALVRHAKVYLFDEPLSNLDAKLRVEMRAELNRIHNRLQATMIYVTHDQIEAMTLGDRIVIMKDGLVQQCDSPLRIYDFPANKFVASFIGSPAMNFLEGKLDTVDGKLQFIFGDNRVIVPEKFHEQVKREVGHDIFFGVRPEHIYDIKLAKSRGEPEQEGAVVSGTIEVIERLGNEILLYLSTSGQKLILKEDAHCAAEVGQKINVAFKMDMIHIFDRKTESNLTLA